MAPIHHTHPQGSQEWKDARSGKITASLAAACLRFHPYTSAAAAYRQILGTEVVEENDFMKWGTQFEPVARSAYEVETGELVQEVGFFESGKFPWLGASTDGLVGDHGILELKCPGGENFPSSCPVYHRIQAFAGMIVTERIFCDYYCWCGELRYLERIHWNLPEADFLINGLIEFHRDHLLPGIEPGRKKTARRKKGEPEKLKDPWEEYQDAIANYKEMNQS